MENGGVYGVWILCSLSSIACLETLIKFKFI